MPASETAVSTFSPGAGGLVHSSDTRLSGNPSTVHARDFANLDVNGDGREDLVIADHGTDTAPFPGGIARLFVQDAPVCLLDEPLALLDPAHAQAVEAALRALAAEGRVVVASTHHLPFAARADRVVAIDPDWIEHGPPASALAPDRIRALFGVETPGCPCCGQVLALS